MTKRSIIIEGDSIARAEEQGYRHTQVAALKQVHAAEILAAEARGYADAEREIASWLYDGDTCECCGCMSIAASEVERGEHRKAGK